MSQEIQAYTVTQLNEIIKGVLNRELSDIWLCGEVSGLSSSSAGHVYLSIKDGKSVINAVFWRSVASRLNFELKDGMEILCRGRIDVYPPSGRYQLIIDYAQPQGEGKLQREYRLLYQKLLSQGLFDPDRKRPIPARIKRIGIITGLGTAALQDFLETLRRRWRGLNVLIAPAKVQGEGAAEQVVSQIINLNRMADPVDVIVLARGGGSPEDLWTFNEEIVVQAVAASRIPTVSAIGHEVDVTLCDFAADLRALTPTEAAERVSPDTLMYQKQLNQYQQRLKMGLVNRVRLSRQSWENLAHHRVFERPFDGIEFRTQQLDELQWAINHAVKQNTINITHKMEKLAGRMESLSPLHTLSRGYSVTLTEQGNVIKSAQQVSSGDTVTTIFQSGKIESIVK